MAVSQRYTVSVCLHFSNRHSKLPLNHTPLLSALCVCHLLGIVMETTGFQNTAGLQDALSGPRLTLMDSFNKTSTYPQEAKIGFGTGSRPSLVALSNTPGPGAYQIKTTLKKTIDSTIESPVAYSIRSRQNFGDPNLKAMSKTTANEPGPGSYKLEEKFLSGRETEKYSFPKERAPMEKSQVGGWVIGWW